MSELEKDFTETIAKVNAKLQTAAKALKQANDLAKKAGYTNGLILSQFNEEDEAIDWGSSDAEGKQQKLEDKYALIDVVDFEAALDEAGWSSSSTYC